jgi:DNA polymerase III alpha subunit (gram-positive type)
MDFGYLTYADLWPENCKLVFVDIETTGLDVKSEIIQIACCVNGECFNQYVMPTCDNIPEEASKINLITLCDGVMFANNVAVESVSLDNAMKLFTDFLRNISQRKKIVLVAHNAKFDAHFIMKYLSQVGLTQMFSEIVVGFLDTLSLSKSVFQDLPSYKLIELGKEFNVLQEATDYSYVHNASYDTHLLERIVEKSGMIFLSQNISKCTFNLNRACTLYSNYVVWLECRRNTRKHCEEDVSEIKTL